MNTVYTTGPTFHIVSVWEDHSCPAQDASKSAAHAPPTNTKTETAPSANRPCPIGMCGCWVCQKESARLSAASPAAACARVGGTDGTTSSGQPTPQTDGNADASAATSPAADAPAVPEWAEKARIPQDIFGRSHQDVLDAIHPLRASRDHWREQVDRANHEWNLCCNKLMDRIRDLEAAQARQMATITELRQGIDTAVVAFCDPEARRRDDPAAEKFYQRWANSPEKPESSWRERCRVVEMPTGKWDIQSQDGLYWWDQGFGKWCSYSREPWAANRGIYRTPSDAYQDISTIPTPPPEAP